VQYLISLWPMLQPILAGQLRHFLTLLAGALIAKGALQSDQSGAFVEIGIGLAGWAAAAVWSWWQKEGQAKILAALAKVHGGAPQSVSTGAAAKAAIDVATVVKILLIVSCGGWFGAGADEIKAADRSVAPQWADRRAVRPAVKARRLRYHAVHQPDRRQRHYRHSELRRVGRVGRRHAIRYRH
jgi:hypothetical protein